MPNFCPECGKRKDECSCQSESAGAGDDLKALLDAIPSPGGGGAQPPAAPKPAAPSAASLKDQLDAIPEPGSGKPTDSGVGMSLKDQLDAIPDPGSRASGARPVVEGGRKDDTPEWMKNYDNARAKMAAPGAVSDDAAIRDQLDNIPAPGGGGGGGAPAAGADGEVPQWMKNYQSHQSANQSRGGPMPNPDSYVPRGDAPPAAGGGSFQMIAVLLVVLCIAFVGFLMMQKPAPPNFDNAATSTSSVPTTPTH